MGTEGRYKAFLSYSHKDAATARWLHRRLESYRIPRRLSGRAAAVPERLTPIFRDREELAAGDDLSEGVRAALARSDALIVLCSPDGAASEWVGREIALFRALHPGRPVFAAIIGGDPPACFPPELVTGPGGAVLEPLAADLRREGDGRRLGLLKLVAGLAGVGLDALVQRDAQRRIRRVMLVTLAALIAVIAMAVLTILALAARAEAERQRQEAEGLVEFMMTDLRDKLQGVGRLDVFTAVNQRALDHYRRQDLAALPADALERRARLLHLMGEDDQKRGETDRALAQFREAARTTRTLLAAKPDDPDRIYTHAQSEYWVGLIAWRTDHFQAAQASFEEYARLVRRLIAMDPTNADWLMEAGYAESNLGTLLLRERNRAAEAEARFRAALNSFAAAARERPGNAGIEWDTADGHAWLANAYRAQHLYPQAFAERERQAALLARMLERDPENARYASGTLGNALGLAQLELDTGDAEAALSRLNRAYAEAEKLGRADPENAEIAKQRIAIGLFAVKAMLRRPVRDAGRIGRLLAACGEPAAREDAELVEFCAVLARQAGLPPVAGASPAGTRPAGWLNGRFSPRWGIDFDSEDRLVHLGGTAS